MRIILTIWAAALMLALFQVPAWAGGFEQGTAHYRRGHYAEALDILQPLARKGDPYAQFALAVMYDDGKGVPQSHSLALKWYLCAARNGLADAQYAAAMYYASGRGIKPNVRKSYFWFNLATAGGYPRGTRARDQQDGELSRSEVAKTQADSVDWLSKHPRQLSCKTRRCIHPAWYPKPRWNKLTLYGW
ncbi:MAG: sel1 repeat family protein [Alphaproteobacteria bacterium]|nr:sel1 repeat family protein [Alphaproteobacteria bacterium]